MENKFKDAFGVPMYPGARVVYSVVDWGSRVVLRNARIIKCALSVGRIPYISVRLESHTSDERDYPIHYNCGWNSNCVRAVWRFDKVVIMPD